MPASYDKLIERVREIGVLVAIEELLDWDQQVTMPPKATAARAEQASLIAGLAHDRLTAPELGEILVGLPEELDDPIQNANLRETRRAHSRAVKIPPELVRELSRTRTLAHEAWEKARRDSDFATFAPLLGKLVDLERQVADRIGYEDEPYDALLDEYEPGTQTRLVAALFEQMQNQLVPLVQALAEAPQRPDESVVRRRFPLEGQRAFVMEIAREMGFDFEAGRMDVSTHPFTSGSCPCDVRLTTRYDEQFLPMAVFGAMHEVGHGLYQQGLPSEHTFTPAGQPVSLGIHESQSRMWENLVGRSRSFWQHYYPRLKKCLPKSLDDVSLDAFVAAVNVVQPSLIRVEADEVTYNLHIVLRFELEREIIDGKLAIDEIPSAWNDRAEALLGIRPRRDAEGCLQDIHWSMGAIGYFPTYALGNLYAAQFFEAARSAIPDLDERIAGGDLGALLHWVRETIHKHGQRYRAPELIEEVTGKPLGIGPFMKYVTGKYRPLYGLE